MRKLLITLIVLVAVVMGLADRGMSLNHPYTPNDIAPGGSLDDHPWGGDNTGGGGITGTRYDKPWYNPTTGNMAIDFFFSRFFYRPYFLKLVTPRTGTTGSTSTTTSQTTGNAPNPNSAE